MKVSRNSNNITHSIVPTTLSTYFFLFRCCTESQCIEKTLLVCTVHNLNYSHICKTYPFFCCWRCCFAVDYCLRVRDLMMYAQSVPLLGFCFDIFFMVLLGAYWDSWRFSIICSLEWWKQINKGHKTCKIWFRKSKKTLFISCCYCLGIPVANIKYGIEIGNYYSVLLWISWQQSNWVIESLCANAISFRIYLNHNKNEPTTATTATHKWLCVNLDGKKMTKIKWIN